MNRHTDRPALPAPARIHATINGARIALPSMTQHLVGGWEDSAGPRTTEYIRADLVAGLKDALVQIATGDGAYGAQAHEYKQIARAALEKAGAS